MAARRWLGATLLVGAFAAAGAPLIRAAEAATVADFAGRWRGVEVTEGAGRDAPLGVEPGDLDVTVAPDKDGFRVSWTTPDGDRVEAAFAPTDRPGVFVVRPSSNPLFGLFSSPETGNPLQGERLLWSRLEGDTLVVYNLSLDDSGDFRLNRYAWTLADGGLTLDFSRLSQGPTKQTLSGRLERAGG